MANEPIRKLVRDVWTFKGYEIIEPKRGRHVPVLDMVWARPRDSRVDSGGWVTELRGSAPICKPKRRKNQWVFTIAIFRSKFNTALGIEAQGFCMIKRDK